MINIKNEFKKFLKEYVGNQKKEWKIEIKEEKFNNFFSRLENIINKGKKIIIFGDYDVDGISSTVYMKELIEKFAHIQFGNKEYKVDYVIPSRNDAYGIEYEKFKDYAQDHDLIIVLDNGTHEGFISQITKEDSSKLFVIDHHPNGDFENKEYIINPNIVGDIEISTGILIEYIFQEMRKRYPEMKKNTSPKEFVDLTALSLLSDMANKNHPLVRKLIDLGIEKIDKKRWERDIYKEIFKVLIKPVDVEALSFKLIPLINSAGRLSDNPEIAVRLLSYKSGENVKPSQEFYNDFFYVYELNEIRKEAVSHYFSDYEKEKDKFRDKKLIVFKLDESEENKKIPNAIGINGLIAGEIAKNTGKMVISISEHPLREGYFGSGRGYGIKSYLQKMKEFGSKTEVESFEFGGHNQALGIKITNYDKFMKLYEKFEKYIRQEENFSIENRYFVSKKSISLKEYVELSYYYKEILGKINKNLIEFNDNFYIPVEMKILGIEEFKKGYAKLLVADENEGELFTQVLFTKKNDNINYFDDRKQEFVLKISPFIDIDGVIKTDMYNISFLKDYIEIKQEEEFRNLLDSTEELVRDIKKINDIYKKEFSIKGRKRAEPDIVTKIIITEKNKEQVLKTLKKLQNEVKIWSNNLKKFLLGYSDKSFKDRENILQVISEFDDEFKKYILETINDKKNGIPLQKVEENLYTLIKLTNESKKISEEIKRKVRQKIK